MTSPTSSPPVGPADPSRRRVRYSFASDNRAGAWKDVEGRAYFTGEPTVGSLKVSFFGPFYGGYNVIRLDDDYQYALVSGPNRDYLWILSRTPTIPAAVKQDYLNTARELGFDVDRLVWIRQTPR